MRVTLPISKFHEDHTLPERSEIFVFGSNLAGRHGRGAAKAALRFGAKYGEGVGLHGRAWAIPTKDRKLITLPLEHIAESVAEFLDYARTQVGKENFFVTRIGCGEAGYRDDQIAPMFVGAPVNCSFAEPWRKYLA